MEIDMKIMNLVFDDNIEFESTLHMVIASSILFRSLFRATWTVTVNVLVILGHAGTMVPYITTVTLHHSGLTIRYSLWHHTNWTYENYIVTLRNTELAGLVLFFIGNKVNFCFIKHSARRDLISFCSKITVVGST